MRQIVVFPHPTEPLILAELLGPDGSRILATAYRTPQFTPARVADRLRVLPDNLDVDVVAFPTYAAWRAEAVGGGDLSVVTAFETTAGVHPHGRPADGETGRMCPATGPSDAGQPG